MTTEINKQYTQRVSRDPFDKLAGKTHISVRCMIQDIEPEYCDGWCESYDLDNPTYTDGYDELHLPGLQLECGECGQMHDFEINGVGVHFP